MTFKDFLREHGITVKLPGEHHHATVGRVQFDCPFCSPRSGKYRMGFNERTHVINCWKCGRHRLGDTLQELTGLRWGELAETVKSFEKGKPLPDVPVGGKYVEPIGTGDLLPPHKRFLKKRGFDPDELVTLWGVRGIGISPEWPWRILMPLFYRGEPVSWTARSISDDVPEKYVTATRKQERVHSRDVLFGEDYCGHAIAVVEGPLDVFAGGPGTVCPLGVNPSMAQVVRMSRYPVRVICYDAEPEAQKRAAVLEQKLMDFDGDTWNVQLQTGKDLSRASRKEVKEFRKRFLE